MTIYHKYFGFCKVCGRKTEVWLVEEAKTRKRYYVCRDCFEKSSVTLLNALLIDRMGWGGIG